MAYAPITTYIDRASFGIWSKKDIKQVSVKHVTEPKSFEKLGAIAEDGLYSHALGPIKRFEECATCGLTDLTCPGHYGHIELSVPVYHPMLIQTLFQILNKCCFECYHFRLSANGLTLFLAQLEALSCGFDHLVGHLDEVAKDICKDDKTKNEYMTVMLRDKLNQMISEEKEKTPNFDVQKRPQQRCIVERLSKLFRNFINGQLIKPTKICDHCSQKKETIALHHQSVIVVGIGSSKALDMEILNNVKTKSRKKKADSKIKRTNDLHYLYTDDKKFLTPIGAREILRNVWRTEKNVMRKIFHFINFDTADHGDVKPLSKDSFHPTDLFFVDTILVPPCKFRPPMMQRGYSFEGPRTAALSNVMKQSIVVKDSIDRLVTETDDVEAEQLQVKLQAHWKDLQSSVNCLYDCDMDKYNKTKYPGLKQLIDKKEGLFRKNMMGKRVNFAARSVISPDPNISVDQIGVPLVFAKKLTYPQPVTAFNLEQLRQAVLNGPDVYPGAVSIIFDDGLTVSLTKESVRQNIATRLNYTPRFKSKFQKNKPDSPAVTIVNRHLLNDDVLLFNRQPTLHKPSIMAFRARVLPNEKGFRLHYANCKSFNADFDGDEMNAHLPQSELARSEAYNIASVNHQYLVPKDGSPLGGLIQDHVIAVCILTSRDQIFDKEHYHQLVFCGLAFIDKQLILEPPAIWKPEPMWTGKQVITTIIKNCIPDGKLPPTLKIKSKIGPKILNIPSKYEQLSDCHVYIKDGELLTGFMDKSNVGATPYGLVHLCYELYGGETSSNLMSAFARLSTWYLQLYEGFTLGIADILVENDANEDRSKMIEQSKLVGNESAKEALAVETVVSDDELENKLREAHSDRDPLPMKKLDAAMKKRTDNFSSKISSRCLPDGLLVKFPSNNLQMMIQSGAKGGTVNALQISCLLGQIELEGRRVPLSMSGRSLPSFKPYDTSPKAGGFVTGRFLTGIQPQEFFFHCMAGREGLIDTAVKTSRSGYLQRCLIKHLEGLTVNYDQTVRDSCGSVIQFLYGEDGLDIVKSQMLKHKAFSLLVENHKILSPSQDERKRLNEAKESYEEDVINLTNEIQQWLDRNGEDRIRKVRGSGYLDFQAAFLSEPEQFEKYIIKEEIQDQTESNISILEVGGSTSLDMIDKINSSHGSKDTDLSFERNDCKPTTEELMSAGTQLTTTSGNAMYQAIRKRRQKIQEAWYSLSFKEKRKWNKIWDSCPDPLFSLMNPASHFGVVPEQLDEMIEQFVKKNSDLIVDPALMVGDSMKGESQFNTSIDCDDNPELSRTLLSYWSKLPGNRIKPQMTKHEFYDLCYNLYMKMLAQPGEAVGLLAAQSIGEPSTQMTLNTFHFAGRGEMNVTLGIPRLREILMTASAKIGTPSMDLPLAPVIYDENGVELSVEETELQAERVRLALNAVRLSDVLEYVDVSERLILEPAKVRGLAIDSKESRGKRAKTALDSDRQKSVFPVEYTLEFNFLPSKYYKNEFCSNSKKILKFIEEKFIHQLTDAIAKRIKRLQLAESMFDVATRRLNQTDPSRSKSNENEVGDVEEQELDNYNAEHRAREDVAEESSSSDDEDRAQRSDYEEPDEDDIKLDADETPAEIEADKPDEDDANADEGEILETVLSGVDMTYVINRKNQRWCKLTLLVPGTTTRLDMSSLIESEARKAFVHRVGEITRAFIVKDINASQRGSKCDKMIKTEGVSLLSLVKFNHTLDLNAIYSNDIHAIARTYGIEAAAQAIRREMANVFAVYGIEVDPRHLSLIADYMTYSGTIRGMNRMSMEASASPFQQMSFESTLRYLKWAAILGLQDDIRSPSASLVFGRPTRCGTGLFGTIAQHCEQAAHHQTSHVSRGIKRKTCSRLKELQLEPAVKQEYKPAEKDGTDLVW